MIIQQYNPSSHQSVRSILRTVCNYTSIYQPQRVEDRLSDVKAKDRGMAACRNKKRGEREKMIHLKGREKKKNDGDNIKRMKPGF